MIYDKPAYASRYSRRVTGSQSVRLRPQDYWILTPTKEVQHLMPCFSFYDYGGALHSERHGSGCTHDVWCSERETRQPYYDDKAEVRNGSEAVIRSPPRHRARQLIRAPLSHHPTQCSNQSPRMADWKARRCQANARYQWRIPTRCSPTGGAMTPCGHNTLQSFINV